jgi:integrase
VFRRVSKKGKIGGRGLYPGTIARIIKRIVAAHGYEPSEFAGHSLRAGFVTTAAKKEKPLDAIMRQTGHKSERMVLAYIRVANALGGTNAARGLL